ncbi:MAG TPA: hypothetical protein VLA82_04450 [Actinomycetota bacterium]|nr:hypothetical protein [Actinomycetota bacterium]
MATGWRPTVGDFVAAGLDGDGRVGSYVIRGTSGDRLLLHEVWCEAGRLRESTRRREIRWSDLRDLRRIDPPEC